MSLLSAWNQVTSMEITTNASKHDTHHDYTTGKVVIAKTRQFAAMGSVASGFSFFAATAARNMHWPYWVKRAPLFGFITFNAIGQLPTITGIDNNYTRTTFVGHWYNVLSNGTYKA